jgi:microcystin-dependent protein
MSSNIPTINDLPITQDFKSGDKIIIYRYPLPVDIRNEFTYFPEVADFDRIFIKTDQITFRGDLSTDSNQVSQILNLAKSEYIKLVNNVNSLSSKRPVSYISDTTDISTDTQSASSSIYTQPIKGTNKKITGKNNLILTNNFSINQNNAALSAIDQNSCDGNNVIIDKGVINLPKGTYKIGASITLSPEIQEDVSDYQKYTSLDQISTLREKDLLNSLKESGVNPAYDYALPLFGINLNTLSGYGLLDRDGLETPIEQSDIVSLAKKQQQVWSYLSFDRLTSPEKTILNGTGCTTFNVVGGSITLDLNGYFYNETIQQYGLRVHALGELCPGIISNTYNQDTTNDQIDRIKLRVSDFFNRTKFTQTRITIEKISDIDALSPKIDSPLRSLQPINILHVPLIYEAGWVNKLRAPNTNSIPFNRTTIEKLPFEYRAGVGDYLGEFKCYITEPGSYQGYAKVGDSVRYISQIPDRDGNVSRYSSRYDIRDPSLSILDPGWYGLVSDIKKQVNDFYNTIFRVDANGVITRRWIISTTKKCPPVPVYIQEESGFGDSLFAPTLSASPVFLPTGSIVPYAGITSPDGWLLCDGSVKNISDYPDLSNIIRAQFGPITSTTFTLPDLRGRVVAGVDNMDNIIGIGGGAAERLSYTSIGSTAGSESHLITSSQIGIPQHEHYTYAGINDVARNTGQQDRLTRLAGPGGASVGRASIVSEDATVPHNNVQPTIILNYIIKT